MIRRFRPSPWTAAVPAATLAILATAFAEPPGPQHPPHPDPLRRALDTNGDHALDADEIAKAAESLATLDADKDGRIAREELFMRPPQGFPGRGPGGRGGEGRPWPPSEVGGPPREGGPVPPPPPPPRDGEGFRPPPGPDPDRFIERALAFDADGDGKLDRTELGKFAEQMMGRMRPRGPEGFRRPPRPGRGDADAGPPRPEPSRRPDGEGGPDGPRRPFDEGAPPAESAEGERDAT